jgi:uncharacterized protein
MPTVELVILQPTPFCNISCKYCYLPDRSSKAKMTLETVDKIFAGLFSSGWAAERLDVVWHAGEPLVLPPAYYAEAFRTIERRTPGSINVQHHFQTNAMLINDDWCALFKASGAKIGVSIDGPEEINNANRVTRSGRPTFAETISGINCLQRNGVDFHVISVLSGASLSKARELYEFYQFLGVKNVSFNVEEVEGINTTSSLQDRDKGVEFENFMRQFWNLIVQSGGLYSVREFDETFQSIISPPESCIRNTLAEPFAILSVDCEGNFSTFSPEFLGQKNDYYGDFIIGNFWDSKLEASLESGVFKVMNRDVAAGVGLCRNSCEYFPVCGGGSPVNKLYENGTMVSSETMYCRLRTKIMANLAMEIIENSARDDSERKTPALVNQSEIIDLYIVGAGIAVPDHLTIQTVEVLRACTRIYTNLTESKLNLLPDDLRAKCISLWPLYQENRPRADNYRDVANAVVEKIANERPVAWLTPGHPLVFDSVSTTLIQAARARSWSVSIVPGISSLDTVLVELGYDPASGLLVHEATSLVMQNLALLPSVATLLLQPSAFGSHITHYSSQFEGPDLTLLRDHLLRFHVPEHPCAFVRSASSPGETNRLSWVQLRDLASAPYEAVAGSTLFLPPAPAASPPGRPR